MPNFLTTQYYPDDFQVINAVIEPVLAGAGAINYGFFYADRDLVIDSITIGSSGSPSTATSIRIAFYKTTAGTLASPASAADAVSGTGTALRDPALVNLPTSGGSTLSYTLSTPASDTNLVKAGNWVGFTYTANDVNGAPTYAIQARVRSRLN